MNPFTPEQQRDIDWCVKDMQEYPDDWSGVSKGHITLPDGSIAEVQLIVQANTAKFIDVTLLEHKG